MLSFSAGSIPLLLVSEACHSWIPGTVVMSLQSAEQPHSSGSTPQLSIGVATVSKWTLPFGWRGVGLKTVLSAQVVWILITVYQHSVTCVAHRWRAACEDGRNFLAPWKCPSVPGWCPGMVQVCPRAWIG